MRIASVSGRSVHFIFKTCQIVAGTSMIRQFHELFNLIFGGFLTFGTTVLCAAAVAALAADDLVENRRASGRAFSTSSSSSTPTPAAASLKNSLYRRIGTKHIRSDKIKGNIVDILLYYTTSCKKINLS